MKRREFVKRGAVAATFAFSSAGAGVFGQDKLERRGAAKRVIVVGAGLAGLSAAYELMRAGHEVTILEARARPGGRVRTLREPFSDGLYVEAGALSVYDNHHWTMKYVRDFRLTLDPIVPARPEGRVHFAGEHASSLVGWMQGALESGNRAAREINDAP